VANIFGFDLRESDERTSVIIIVQDKDEFMVLGWTVAKVIPTWVLNFVGWNNLMTSYNATLSQDVEMVNTTNDVFNANNVNVGNNDGVNWCEKEIEDANIKTADPLYVGDGLFQGDDAQKNYNHDVTNEAISSKEGCSGYKQEVTSHQPVSNPYSSIKIEYKSSNVNTKFDVDTDNFDLCGGTFKEELSTNISKAIKSNALDAYVTGPFNNLKTGKSHFTAIFSSFLKGWPLKDSFLCGYLHTLASKMNSMKDSKIDTSHCQSYTEINIRNHEFGAENLWHHLAPKNGKSRNIIKRMSFVLSFDTKLDNKDFLMVRDAFDFLLFSLMKRAKKTVEILLLDHLKDHAQGLYNHLMNGSVSKDLVGENLTNDMNAQFSGGYSISSNDWLNHFMVDYDIIRILKDKVGYTSWSDVPLSERGFCYHGYNAKTVLPEWHIEEEKYNK
jgi:hypothetical protein